MESNIHLYKIPAIPDCGHHRLITLCGGNVREHVFRSFEQLLRMIANFGDTQITLCLRFLFDPRSSVGIQSRLQLQLILRTNGLSPEIAAQLIESGPLKEFYPLEATNSRHDIGLDGQWNGICDLVKG